MSDPVPPPIPPVFFQAADACAREVGDNVALVTLAGSHAYGTERPGSDLDVMGVFIASARDMLGMTPPGKTRKLTTMDATFYELLHFCKLAANANPTVLEILSAPVLTVVPAGRVLRANASLFLSRKARTTYGGYAIAQIRKAEAGTGGSRGVAHLKREKFLMHTLRLLYQGRRLLETGVVHVRLDADIAADLQATAREGLDAVKTRADAMLVDLDAAASTTWLPESPDLDGITDLICTLRGLERTSPVTGTGNSDAE